jgi:hypothetical protein
MRRTKLLGLGLGLSLTALSACSDQQYNPDGPAVDPNAPRIEITSPDYGTFAGDVAMVEVKGTASDDTAVASVTVNDVPAALAADGTWDVMVPVTPGTRLLHAVATDSSGNTGNATRAVVAGTTTPIATKVNNAITASLSAQTFDAIGRGASTYLTTADLESLISASNPLVDVGGGPDCLYGMGSVTSIALGSATKVTLTPQVGGLYLDAELDAPDIGMHLDYAAACIDGSRDITISATHISVTGMMSVGVASGQFAITLDSPNVTITGFDAELGGIPGAVVDLLDLNAAMGPIVGWATEKFVTPAINTALAGLNTAKTISVLGTPVDINVTPATINFDTTGAIVELNTSFRAHGDDASPGFVELQDLTPSMSTAHGFELAVASNAANQLFGSFWAAKGMEATIPLTTGDYATLGQLYDSVQLSAKVPPFVDASGDSLKLTIGDLMATFMSGEIAVTQIAVNAEVDLQVKTDPMTGDVRLDVGTPTTYVDVLDQGVMGANELSNAQFDAITSFALSRIVAYGSGAVGAIPMPSVGGVSVKDVSIAEQVGYLVVDGDVQ